MQRVRIGTRWRSEVNLNRPRRRLCDRRLDSLNSGASAIGIWNSTGRSLFGPGSGNGNSLLRIRIPCSQSLGNSVKKHCDLAGAGQSLAKQAMARWSVSPRGIGPRGHCAPPQIGSPASPASRPPPALCARSPTLNLALPGLPRCLNIMLLVKPATVVQWRRRGLRL